MNKDGHLQDKDGFVMIERHQDCGLGYFNEKVLTSGVENPDDPLNANTYCIIGSLNPEDYFQEAGYYDLKLIYRYGMQKTPEVLKWTQTSWITQSHVTGAYLKNIVDSYRDRGDHGREFRGLAKTSRKESYLDGNGDSFSNWWHAVASTKAHKKGIPGHEMKIAYASSLWIRPAGIVLTSQLLVCPMTNPIFRVHSFHSYTLPMAVIVDQIQ